MLDNEKGIEAERRSAENRKLILDLFSSVDSCVLRGDADKTINMLQAAKETEADETMKPFIDHLIELINDAKNKTGLSARDQASAEANNWTLLRRLIAQRGFSITSLSKKTGIARETISRHLIDGNFKISHVFKIKDALNIPAEQIKYYFFDEI